VLGVVVPAGRDADAELGRLVEEARQAASGSVLIVVAGTGSDRTLGRTVPAHDLLSQVEERASGPGLIDAAVPGGLFLDQRTLAAEGITGQVAVDALLDVTTPHGQPMMADAFQGFAVSFARYC
jgi:hypothetical protein